ncbi:unnamed protein product, partial [Polarella glacialis]
VADFGLARVDACGETSRQDMTAAVGTFRWMAPEVFAMDGGCTYNELADVFSFAMVMYEVLARKLPYSNEFPGSISDPRISLHVIMGLRPDIGIPDLEAYPKDLLQLMTKSWASDSSERPDFQELETRLLELLADGDARSLRDGVGSDSVASFNRMAGMRRETSS